MQTNPLPKYSQSFIKILNKYLQKAINKKQIIKNILQQLIVSEQLSYWIILKQILNNKEIFEKNNYNYSQYKKYIIDLIKDDRINVTMKIYLYSWLNQQKAYYNYYWSLQLKRMFNQGKFMIFNSWISQSQQWNSYQTIQTINMLIKNFPILIKNQRINIQTIYIQFILYLFCFFDLKYQEQLQSLKNLINILKEFRIYSSSYYQRQKYDQYNQKQQKIILKNLLETLAKNPKARGNVSMIFTFIPENQIKQFIYFNSNLLIEFNQNQIVNMFKKIFISALEPKALILFYQYSMILKQNQKYYQLKLLYQKIVLPILIRRGKTSKKAMEIIYDIIVSYVIGFYANCNLDKNAIICLIQNIKLIENLKIRNNFIILALLVAQKDKQNLFNFSLQLLEKQGFKKQFVNSLYKKQNFEQFIPKTIWEITARNLRKTKNYKKQLTRQYKGIQNKGSECYIIVVLQALFTTNHLQQILSEYRTSRRGELCWALKQIFQDLNTKNTYSVQIKNVKNNGPQQFKLSQIQQDTQQFLIKLFQKVQQQLTKQNQKLLIQQINKTFKIQVQRKIQCQKCHKIIVKNQQHYIYSISNKSSLSKKQVQKIQDYKCSECYSKQIKLTIQLKPTSKIFLVHFNRFSFSNNQCIKQLYTPKIQRKFQKYNLKGIIFHIGKNVYSGHYVYYFKLNSKTWIQMNDNNIFKIQLDQQNEQFQRQMQAQMTPYILIYQKQQNQLK